MPESTPELENNLAPEILRPLMLGLLYPAVLGTVFINALDYLFFNFSLGVIASGALTTKPFFLIVTIAFYMADYLYLHFTRSFGAFFFLFDLGFLAAIWTTVKAINIPRTNVPGDIQLDPNLETIVNCYLVFFGLYLIWDLLELSRSKLSEERTWYLRWVLPWEGLSLLALAVVYFLGLSNDWKYCLVLGVLMVITGFFWAIVLQKRKFFEVPEGT